MAIKIIVLCGLFAIALGFTIPEENFNELAEAEPASPGDYESPILVRKVRSPQRKVEIRGEHDSRYGANAGIEYTHPLGKNFEVYGGGSRNFRYNDNRGYTGFRYRF